MTKKSSADSGDSEKEVALQVLVPLFFILILAACGVVLWEYNAHGVLNPGLTFNVLNEKESDNFDEALAFLYDAQFADPDISGVQKWAEPMRIKVEGDPSDRDLKALNDIVNAFNNIDGFPGMQIVSIGGSDSGGSSGNGGSNGDGSSSGSNGGNSGGSGGSGGGSGGGNSDANVRIIYTTKDNYERIKSQNDVDSYAKSFCRSSRIGGEIYQSVVVIEPDRPSQGYRNSIVLHEMSHAIGFYYHVSDKNSIMNDRGPVRGLSKTDTLALKMLYNSDIPIGMPYSEFADYYSSTTVKVFLNH
jgi:hypothetical protein